MEKTFRERERVREPERKCVKATETKINGRKKNCPLNKWREILLVQKVLPHFI